MWLERFLERTRPWTPIIAMLYALSFGGCAAPPSAQIRVAQPFRAPCAKPTSPMRTAGDKDALLIRQEEALGDCEAKRAGLVALIDAAAPKRKWWQRR